MAVERCPAAAGECVGVDVSPDLQLYDDLELYISDDLPYVGSNPNSNRLLYRPTGTGTTRWQGQTTPLTVAYPDLRMPEPRG